MNGSAARQQRWAPPSAVLPSASLTCPAVLLPEGEGECEGEREDEHGRGHEGEGEGEPMSPPLVALLPVAPPPVTLQGITAVAASSGGGHS